MDGTWPARTWSDASVLVHDRIRQLFSTAANNPRDAYGWRDDDALTPAPADADVLLKKLAAGLTDRVGSLEEPARNGTRGGYAPRPGDDAYFAAWAKQLRWLRGATTDFSTWGAAMGRLRWLALQNGSQRSELSEWLDPDFRPTSNWSQAHPALPTAADSPSAATFVVNVRTQLEGLRALVVEGTAPDAEDGTKARLQLEQTFGLSVTACTADDLDTAVAQVRQGATDVVVFLTCFEDFDADARLAAAAQGHDVPYVRLYPSHALSSARAFEQQMNLNNSR